MRWDIFCKVIDNYGDAGVCWRLSADLAARGETVRLWIDDPSALAWMAPQGRPGVQTVPWRPDTPAGIPGDVVIEAFGCSPPTAFVEAMTRKPPVWINLEYLTAEAFAERQHGLPSPVLAGPGRGLTKYFFQPGFTARTGSLLREPELARRKAGFDAGHWLRSRGIPLRPGERRIALFCYEPTALPDLLRQLARGPEPTRLLVTAGRATAAVQHLLNTHFSEEIGLKSPSNIDSLLSISYLSFLPQAEFDALLWASDFNFVRGEDSLARAIWAGKPFVWQLYPQDDGAHHAKLNAWLDRLRAPEALRQAHAIWNGIASDPLPPLGAADWTDPVTTLARELGAESDQTTRLLAFVAERR